MKSDLYNTLYGKKLIEAEQLLRREGIAFKVFRTAPPRENDELRPDARVLRISITEDQTVELVACNTYTYR